MNCDGFAKDILEIARSNMAVIPTLITGSVALICGIAAYFFKVRPEQQMKQREEDRLIIDRTRMLKDEFKLLSNLNSSQRHDLFKKMESDSISIEECRERYRSIRESLTEIMNKITDICTEYFGASPESRHRFYKYELAPFLRALLKEGVLESIHQTEIGLLEVKSTWSKNDLHVLREFVLSNCGLFNKPYTRWCMRKLHT